VRLPRDLSGDALAARLRRYGYTPTRQTGSHLRLTRLTDAGEHHVTIPRHESLRVGTLSAVLGDVAQHLGVDRRELTASLFGR
jgi:predicted RNA binding protein YcfA (HicA-like mRNA interferase family)